MTIERIFEVRHWFTRTISNGQRWISTHHLIDIAFPPAEVLAIADDLSRWPDMFPPCQSLEIVAREGQITRFRLSAYAGEKVVSWLSQREVNKEHGRVDFVQLEPFAPIAVMKGTWRFKEVPGGTLIDFVHHFTLDRTHPMVASPSLFMQAELDLCRSVDANSTAELLAIRDVCEQSLERKGT